MSITEYNEQKEFAKEFQEGRKEGFQQGSYERAIRTALIMMQHGESNSYIKFYTELPESTIEDLRKTEEQKKRKQRNDMRVTENCNYSIRRRGLEKTSKDIEAYADEKAILEVIQAYRAAKLSDKEVKKYLIERFHLEEKEAEKYEKLLSDT